jgi:ABC-type lipoprotein export system ATPase subunit
VAEEILKLEKVCKDYNVGLLSEARVLHDVDLTLKRGEFLALMGPSGSGKCTLLNIVGLLDRPPHDQGRGHGRPARRGNHAPARPHDRLCVSISHAYFRLHGARKRDDANAR